MKKILSKISLNSLSSSDSYNSLKDLDKPNHISCPICLMETSDNKILKCKHGICKQCFTQLKKLHHINVLVAEKNIINPLWILP